MTVIRYGRNEPGGRYEPGTRVNRYEADDGEGAFNVYESLHPLVAARIFQDTGINASELPEYDGDDPGNFELERFSSEQVLGEVSAELDEVTGTLSGLDGMPWYQRFGSEHRTTRTKLGNRRDALALVAVTVLIRQRERALRKQWFTEGREIAMVPIRHDRDIDDAVNINQALARAEERKGGELMSDEKSGLIQKLIVASYSQRDAED